MMGTNYRRGSMLDLSGAECLAFLSFFLPPIPGKRLQAKVFPPGERG